MVGIYIHIPFCKKRCIYCDFFSSVSSHEIVSTYIDELGKELAERKDYPGEQSLDTVYFGGGTPSQLNAQDFRRVFDYIREAGFTIRPDAEITFEANPDDLSDEYLASLRELPFNRISIGIQSFDDKELAFLNRRHTGGAAIEAVRLVQQHGYRNISLDLMYGLPGQTLLQWEENIRQAIALDVSHISAYHLIYEEDTQLNALLANKKIIPVDEELSLAMFDTLIDRLEAAGFEHYEISNFAKPGLRSRHNSSYWNGSHYLGIGAAAHSFNGTSRQWNKPAVKAGLITYSPEIELPEEKSRYNDFILTRLRTKEGIGLSELSSLFGKEKEAWCLAQAAKHIRNATITHQGDRLRLTRKGIFISDGIISDLMAD